MSFITSIVEFWNANSALLAGIFAALWGLSEALAQIPSVAANSVYQAIKNGIKFINETVFKKPV